MQRHFVDHDGGLAAVVDDPVVADDFRHSAEVEVNVDVEFGRCSPCRVNRDAGRRADGSLIPDEDLAAARQKDARSLSRAAVHPFVYRDGLLAVAVGSRCGYALRISVGVDDTDPDAVRSIPAGLDAAPDPAGLETAPMVILMLLEASVPK